MIAEGSFAIWQFLERLKGYAAPIRTQAGAREISRKMPFASGDAHSAGSKGSEAPPGAEASAPFGRLSERSRS